MIVVDNAKRIHLQRQRLWLLPQKALYWQKRKTLMIADPHLGKTGHFRKNGIPVPKDVNSTNLQKIDTLLQSSDINHLIILGDLFHSRYNLEWENFFEWRSGRPELEVSLVIGNHDILSSNRYHSSRINLFHKLRVSPFLLVHDLNSIKSAGEPDYILSGHIHPAVRLTGKGRQAMKLPCFCFGHNNGVLPAFGEFTGTHTIEPNSDDKIWVVIEDQVIALNT